MMIVTRLSASAALAACLLLFTTLSARADAPAVVVSVKPLHAITAAVTAGIATPRLLVKGSASPHDYAMRPSDAAALNDAELFVWIGESFELFLAKPLQALAGNVKAIRLMDLAGEGDDPHLWLDPDNARKIAERVTDALIILDPDNGDRYRSNSIAFAARLDLLDASLRATLAPVTDKPYLVFHDAYGAFERRYGLTRLAAITINPQRKPGAKRIVALRDLISESGAGCLFAEPQFTPALLATLIEGSAARIGQLDPLGASLPPGPEAYFTLMIGLAENLRACLMTD